MLGVMAKKSPIWNAKTIKALRQRLGLKQAEIAKRIRVSQSIWSCWERGTYLPDSRSLLLLDLLDQGKL